MFFVLSKLLMFTISPLTWIIVLLCLSLFLKNKIWKVKLLRITLILVLFFSNAFILDEFYRIWEIGYVQDSSIKKSYDYGILLGGIGEYDSTYNRINFNKSSDRLLQIIKLYEQKKIKKIIISSGSGSILHPEQIEADFVANYLVDIGIPATDIIKENKSKNTHENALFTKKITKKLNPKASYLLVTSAFHMRRARDCFKKIGLNIDMYAVDKKTGPRKYEFDYLFLPNKEAFYYWDLLLHEWAGFVVYKIMGYA